MNRPLCKGMASDPAPCFIRPRNEESRTICVARAHENQFWALKAMAANVVGHGRPALLKFLPILARSARGDVSFGSSAHRNRDGRFGPCGSLASEKRNVAKQHESHESPRAESLWSLPFSREGSCLTGASIPRVSCR